MVPLQFKCEIINSQCAEPKVGLISLDGGRCIMNSFYLILGSEAALADRALTKLTAQLKDEKCEITTLFAADLLVGGELG